MTDQEYLDKLRSDLAAAKKLPKGPARRQRIAQLEELLSISARKPRGEGRSAISANVEYKSKLYRAWREPRGPVNVARLTDGKWQTMLDADVSYDLASVIDAALSKAGRERHAPSSLDAKIARIARGE